MVLPGFQNQQMPQRKVRPDRLAELRAQMDGKPIGAPTPVRPTLGVKTNVGSIAAGPGVKQGAVGGAGAASPITTTGQLGDQGGKMQNDPAMQADPNAKPPKTIDQDEEDFIRSLIEGGGNVDTSAQEQAIKDASDRLMGRNLVDARARGGRFGAMGAQGAIEGDIRNQAAQQESQQIIDARNKAQQQAIDNALKGISGDTDLRSAGEDSAIFDMITEMLGQKPPTGGSTNGGTGANPLDGLNDGLNDPHTALRPNGRQPLPPGFDASQAVSGGLVLGGIAGVDKYLGSDDAFDYYQGSDGKIHKEKRSS